jgi:hypothetical protein
MTLRSEYENSLADANVDDAATFVGRMETFCVSHAFK